MSKQQRIRRYWEDPQTISLLDKNLQQLEEDIALQYLKPHHIILDLGCGDGVSTVKYARRVKTCIALERSDYLFSKAQKTIRKANLRNIKLIKGDILEIPGYKDSFDRIITQRVLINLATWKDQMKAIKKIHFSLRKNGYYLMIENTYEGQDALNRVRRAVGLPDIPLHWHNLFFHHDKLIKFLKDKFKIVKHHRFDLYYLLSRVYVNMFATFERYGRQAKKSPIFNYSDPAALRLFKVFGDTLRIDNKYAFGPIQCFILQKY